ncbi:MAG: DUF359 domain-containing protein [Nitrososphaerota archaeon]|nr:DUF359 domain-containing protein [Nitrososphaerota archaeon]
MKDLVPDEGLRARLREPLGTLIPDAEVAAYLRSLPGRPVVAVGDRTALRCMEAGLEPLLQIVDNREMRRNAPPLPGDGSGEIRVANPAGRITEEATRAIEGALAGGRRTRIVVEGEEDLLVLPCVMHAPRGALVLYGQPGEGLVAVEVDGGKREGVLSLLREMGWAAGP